MRGREREGEKVQNKKLRASEMGRWRKRNFGGRRKGEREMKKKVKNIFSKIIIILILTSFYFKLSTERNRLKKIVNFLKNTWVKIFFLEKSVLT